MTQSKTTSAAGVRARLTLDLSNKLNQEAERLAAANGVTKDDVLRFARELLAKKADAALAAPAAKGGTEVPAGLAIVPEHPTPEMLAAWWRTKNTGTTEIGGEHKDSSDVAAYRAMLAASPPPPAGAAGGGSGDLSLGDFGLLLQDILRQFAWDVEASPVRPGMSVEEFSPRFEATRSASEAIMAAASRLTHRAPKTGSGDLGALSAEAVAAAYYDCMIGDPKEFWPHHDGWAGKPEAFKAKVRNRMAKALKIAASSAPHSPDFRTQVWTLTDETAVTAHEGPCRVWVNRETGQSQCFSVSINPNEGDNQLSPTPDLGAQGEPVAWAKQAEALIEAARELFGYASYAEIVGGIRVNRTEIRKWCDNTRGAAFDLEAALDAASDRPLYEAPAAPRTGSGVSVEEIAKTIVTHAYGKFDGSHKAARAILALFAQAPRDGGETQGGWQPIEQAPDYGVIVVDGDGSGWVSESGHKLGPYLAHKKADQYSENWARWRVNGTHPPKLINPSRFYSVPNYIAPTPPSGVETIRQDNTSGGK